MLQQYPIYLLSTPGVGGVCFFAFYPSAFNEMDGRKALAARDEWSPAPGAFRSMHVSSLRSWLVINCNGRAKKLRLGQDW
jgi:hypothetical protein